MGWGPNFERTKTLLEKELNLSVPIDESRAPIAPLGTMFWFRPAALKPLFDHDWQWEDFPPEPNNIDGTILHAIERAYGYVAQASGYFCGWLFSDSFARIEITSLSHYVQDFTHAVAENGILGYEDDMVNNLRKRGAERKRIKKQVARWVPAPLHRPLVRAYRRARRIGR